MDKEFDKSVGEERDKFVIAVREQEWNTKLRTAAENILVMYDQMREKLAAPSLREQPLREALEKIGDRCESGIYDAVDEAFIIEAARTALASESDVQSELQQLRDWKESAMSVMPDYQAIGKEIGVRLGDSVHDKILPYIQKLKAALASEGAEGNFYTDEEIEKIASDAWDACVKYYYGEDYKPIPDKTEYLKSIKHDT